LFSGGIRLASHSLHFPAVEYRHAIKEDEKLIALGAAVTLPHRLLSSHLGLRLIVIPERIYIAAYAVFLR
jgi:hypothetical protein